MLAYKLFRLMSNGEIAPLFINKRQRIPLGTWLDAELHETKGFKPRKGWHCTLSPVAPHLSEKGRVWRQVEVVDYVEYTRPKAQGGVWVLAQQMKVL